MFFTYPKVSFPPAQSLNQYLVALTNGHFTLVLDNGLKPQRHFGAWLPREQQESLPPLRTVLIVFHFFSKHCTIRSDSFHLSFPAPPCKGNTMKYFSRGTCLISQILALPTQALFLSIQGMGWTCQGASDVFYPIICLKIVKKPQKLSYGTSWLLQQRGQSVFPQYTTKSGSFPGKVLHMLWASYPLRWQDSGERGLCSVQCE